MITLNVVWSLMVLEPIQLIYKKKNWNSYTLHDSITVSRSLILWALNFYHVLTDDKFHILAINVVLFEFTFRIVNKNTKFLTIQFCTVNDLAFFIVNLITQGNKAHFGVIRKCMNARPDIYNIKSPYTDTLSGIFLIELFYMETLNNR